MARVYICKYIEEKKARRKQLGKIKKKNEKAFKVIPFYAKNKRVKSDHTEK
jgi:hypothetical protein